MPKGIEINKKQQVLEGAVTPMCPDGLLRWRGHFSHRARENASVLSSGCLRIFADLSPHRASPVSLWVKVMPDTYRTRHRSLSRSEDFPAEGPTVRSASAVSAASRNTRSPQAGDPQSSQRLWSSIAPFRSLSNSTAGAICVSFSVKGAK